MDTGVQRIDPDRLVDRLEIQDLTTAYANSVDSRDWVRFEGLFVPDARIDYTSAGGTAGTPAEVAAWMPEAFAIFLWTMHSMSTQEIRFADADHASGSTHVIARHGVAWEGEEQLMDVGGTYADDYVRTVEGWRFAARTEHTVYFLGDSFADVAREAARRG